MLFRSQSQIPDFNPREKNVAREGNVWSILTYNPDSNLKFCLVQEKVNK